MPGSVSEGERNPEVIALACLDLIGKVKAWALEVFTGVKGFDQEQERIFKEVLGCQLAEARKAWVLQRNSLRKGSGYLANAILEMEFLLSNWVSPRKAVAPGPRIRLDPKVVEEAKEQLKYLKPLPHILKGD